MKTLFLITMLVSNLAFANCEIRSASVQNNERTVGKVTDLVKTKSYVKGLDVCTVTFNIVVDGEQHSVKEEVTGWEQYASLCHYAVERGRKNLLQSLGGTFSTETVSSCTDGKTMLNREIKKGDLILENEVGRSKMNEYFTYQGNRCRMFHEKYDQDRTLKQRYGVICQTRKSAADWEVIDKW